MALSPETFLLVLSSIIFIGFVGNLLLNKKGIPQTLFLIAAGIATRWFAVLPTSTVNAMLPLLSQVTLAMVVFDIGMSLKVREVMSEGKSAIARSSVYMVLAILVTTFLFTAVLHWSLYQALFLGSIVGGEISMIIVPYMGQRISQQGLMSNLSLESVYDSLILIILFTVLLNGYNQNAPLDLSGLSLISSSFFQQLSIGLVGGVILGLAWVRVTKAVGQSDFFYVATVGYVLLAYVLVGDVGGSGVITVLAIGLVMKNLADLPASLGLGVAMPAVSLNYISAFQTEISFFLRTFFLFFLGFSLPIGVLASPQVYLESLAVMGILVATRVLSTEAVDWKKSAKARRLIETMMAQGLTPALLATTLVADSVSGSSQILPIAALVIIGTNVVAAGGARLFSGPSEGLDLSSLATIGPLVKELSGLVDGLDQNQLERWVEKVEGDAKDAAPPEVKGRVSVPRPSRDGERRVELKVSASAAPFIIEAIKKNKDSMPQGARSYFETLEEALAKELGSRGP
ncbi:MAG: cation:proton antiporter [Nitrososphaerota archaeon]|nr:cation:proton antiporter [Nitrososphaerota archaeon]